MPPAIRFTREAVLNAAYELVRREGPSALNARAVARELGGSTQPIFRLFSGMDELRLEIIRLADESICRRMSENASQSRNAYLSICMTYLLFARDEPQLFKLLFMRDRSSDGSLTDFNISWGIPLIENSVQVDVDTARNAKMPLLAVCWGFRTREELVAAGAEHIVDNAEDMLKALL